MKQPVLMESNSRFFFSVAHICFGKKSYEHDGCTWWMAWWHRQLSWFQRLEAAMRSEPREPVSVSRARPEWKDRQTPGCFRVNVGVDPVAFGQWILSIRSLNMVSRCHVFAKDIPIRNHSRISCQPSGSSLHQSRVTWLEVEFGLGGVEQCPVELVIFLLICGLDWNKWIPELWIQNLSNGWDKFVQQLDCESWILVKYSQDVLECYFKDCFIAVAAAIEWLIPGWVEYLLPPIVRSWNGTQIFWANVVWCLKCLPGHCPYFFTRKCLQQWSVVEWGSLPQIGPRLQLNSVES